MTFNMPSNEQLKSATPAELAQLAAECLAGLEPGRQPLPLFKELARLVVLSTVEIVPLRKSNDRFEVLLAKRPEDDIWWPNQLHLPGSVQMPMGDDEPFSTDDYTTPVDRILADDFGDSVTRIGDVKLFDVQRRHDVRGSEQTAFAWTQADLASGAQKVKGGDFFDADIVMNDPDAFRLIEGHAEIIDKALSDFRES